MDDFIQLDEDGKPNFRATVGAISKAIGDRADNARVERLAQDFIDFQKRVQEDREKDAATIKHLEDEALRLAQSKAQDDVPSMPEWVQEGTKSVRKFLYGSRQPRWVEKAISANSSIPGSVVDTIVPYFNPQAGNPLAGLMTRQRVMGDTFKVPQITSVTFNEEANIPFDGNKPNRANQGSLSSNSVTVKAYTCQVVASRPSTEDVEGLEMAITRMIMNRAANTIGSTSVGIIKAEVAKAAPSIDVVSDGDADAYPTNAELSTALESMLSNLGEAFRGDPTNALLVSPKIESIARTIVQGGTGSNRIWDARTGMDMFNGYPVILTDHLDDSNAAGECGAVLGNFGLGIFCGDREELTIERYTETVPGAYTYFATIRFAPVIWNANALVGLKSAD